jgi:hypothetical protein
MRCAVPLLGSTILVLAACGHSSHTSATRTRSISNDVHGRVARRNLLIVPAVSIGNIRFGESRRAVERSLGTGKRIARDYFAYLGGRLRIGYSYHDQYTGRAQALVTTWSGYHTRTGIHVGSSRHALNGLHLNCFSGMCASPQNPDYPGIIFYMRHGRVVQIFVGAS